MIVHHIKMIHPHQNSKPRKLDMINILVDYSENQDLLFEKGDFGLFLEYLSRLNRKASMYYLLAISFDLQRRIIQKAIILGGDADYVPAVNIAKEEMVLTKVVYVPGHCSPHLFQACDERNRLTQTLIDLVSF